MSLAPEDDENTPRPPSPVPMYPADLVEAVVTGLEDELRAVREELATAVARLDALTTPGAQAPTEIAAGGDPFTAFLDDLHDRDEPSPPTRRPGHDPAGNAG